MAEKLPCVSVVIGCHRDDLLLQDTLDSIASQQHASSWECLIVANGQFKASDHLENRLAADGRFRLLHSPHQGLTEALILGCAHARGSFIARIDAGDVMAPERLQRQVEALGADPYAVLCTSSVQISGPCWEPLWIEHGTGDAIDVPHHASVLFSRDDYEAVGCYRRAFYFGQDWDLWYRLAERGRFLVLPQVLTYARLQPDGISSRHRRQQVEIARLSLACREARLRGEPEAPWLEQASSIRPTKSSSDSLPRTSTYFWDRRRAEGFYFIAEALRRNGDLRCMRYFMSAFRYGFWMPRVWVRFVQSVSLRFTR